MTKQPCKELIPITKPSMGDDEWQAVREPLFSGQITQGKIVEAFEREFAQAYKVRHGIACTSATAGLHITLKALGIGPGDEVIVPAFTWISTANAVLYCGATPVFVDICLNTFNINPGLISDAISPKTKAIIVVHLFGRPADIDAIRITTKNIPIIEDAACAVGTQYKGSFAGSLGVAGVFSFHPRKILTTGEGGMITTDQSKFAETLKIYRNHGASLHGVSSLTSDAPHSMPDFDELGFNYRYTDIQAAIGRIQLKKINSFIAERAELAMRYRTQLASLSWLTQPDHSLDPLSQHSWQSYVTLLNPKKTKKSRNEVMQILKSENIQTRPGTHAIVNLNYYKRVLNIDPSRFTCALTAESQSIALPLFNGMSLDQQARVIDCLAQI